MSTEEQKINVQCLTLRGRLDVNLRHANFARYNFRTECNWSTIVAWMDSPPLLLQHDVTSRAATTFMARETEKYDCNDPSFSVSSHNFVSSATTMDGAHGNETRSDCRSLNAPSIGHMCMAWTCGVPERHALLLRQSLFCHFRDQSRLQVVQAATVERIYARCVVWQGACVIHVGAAD